MLRYFSFCLLLMFTLTAHGVSVPDFYVVRQPVETERPSEWDAALVLAQDTLLLRLTGDPHILENPAIQAQRSTPKNVIEKYVFSKGPPQVLVVSFNSQKMETLLRNAEIPFWKNNRPKTTLWWMTSSGGTVSLVEETEGKSELFHASAKRYGIPLTVPLPNPDEQERVRDAIFAGDEIPLQSLSEPYAPDTIVSVFAHGDAGNMKAEWKLWMGDIVEQGQVSAPDIGGLADAVFLSLVRTLLPYFTVSRDGASELVLVVRGGDFQRYYQLEQTLAAFQGQLMEIGQDHMVYKVKASADQIRAQLGLLKLHERDWAGDAYTGGNLFLNELYFSW